MRSKSTFTGDFKVGGEYSFTEGVVYDYIKWQGGYVIKDDNNNGVKFSQEHAQENFDRVR